MGTGYTRNDTANNIADGNIINASDLDGEFDAVQSAFNASTGHTHDGTAGEGAPIETIGPSQDVVATASVLRPKTDNTVDLGTTSLEYKDLFLDGTAHIDTLDVDENASITGTLGVTGTTTLGTANITTGTITTADINGGNIDGTIIGATTAAAITGTTITGTSFVTSGDMTFGDNDKAVFGAGSDLTIFSDGGTFSYINNTQGVLRIRNTSDDKDVIIQSDNGSGGVTDYFTADGSTGAAIMYNYGSEKLATTSTGIDVTGTITFDGGTTSADLNFGDNDKAIFGAGSDLQIYHDPSGPSSLISDQGAGDLILRGSNQIRFQDATGAEHYAIFNENGAVQLYYDNAEKLATTSTGIDVTGTVTADGLTVDGNTAANGTLTITTSSNTMLDLVDTSASFRPSIRFMKDDGGVTQLHMLRNENGELDVLRGTSSLNQARFASNGDISFYDSLGSSQSFFWDASAESLGLGATSFAGETLRMERSGDMIVGLFSGASSSTFLNMGTTSNRDIGQIGYTQSTNHMFFRTNDAERMRIDSSGNLLVGKTLSSSTEDGLELRSTNVAVFTRDGGNPLGLNRKTSDGDIIVFNKDGSTVGSIGAVSADLYIGTGNTSLRFYDGTSAVLPTGTNGAQRSDAISLGDTNNRFKDLHMSGAAYVGGSGVVGRFGNTTANNYVEVIRTTTAPSYINIGATSAAASIEGGPRLQFSITDASGSGSSEAMRIDSSGNVGIGTSSPSANLHLSGQSQTIKLETTNDSSTFLNIRANSGTGGSFYVGQDSSAGSSFGRGAYAGVVWQSGAYPIVLATNNTERMRLTSGGILQIAGGGNDNVGEINMGNTAQNANRFQVRHQSNTWILKTVDSEPLLFGTANAEAMRINTSGNLLVGKTNDADSNAGVRIRGDGLIQATRDGADPLSVNRTSSDGDIAIFRKDGTAVGSIGVAASDNLYIAGATGNTKGLYFSDGGTYPANTGGAPQDAQSDLGGATVRFKDLYLSGGVYLGGTGSANKLDDYEEGTWTPTYESAGSNAITVTYDIRVGRYVKVGNMVKATFRIRTDAVSGRSSDSLRVTGLPFSAANVSSMHYGGAIGRRIGWGNKPATVYVQTNQSYLLMIRDGSEGSGTLTTTNDMATGANDNDLDVTVVYQTA